MAHGPRYVLTRTPATKQDVTGHPERMVVVPTADMIWVSFIIRYSSTELTCITRANSHINLKTGHSSIYARQRIKTATRMSQVPIPPKHRRKIGGPSACRRSHCDARRDGVPRPRPYAVQRSGTIRRLVSLQRLQRIPKRENCESPNDARAVSRP